MVIQLKTYQKHFTVFPDSKIDFDENIKEYLIKLVNILVLFGSSGIFYRDNLFYKSKNFFLDLTSGI